MIKEEKKRFVVLIEPEIFHTFKDLAQQENRSASNLAVKLIKDYIKEHGTNQ